VLRRPDGKPELPGADAPHVSSAHARDLTLGVASARRVACDLEIVEGRSPDLWRDLLGADGIRLAELIAGEASERVCASATRVWAAQECLKKAGAVKGGALVYADSTADGWVTLASGTSSFASTLCRVEGIPEPVVVGILSQAGDEGV
jgi:enediyne polyketide synthase